MKHNILPDVVHTRNIEDRKMKELVDQWILLEIKKKAESPRKRKRNKKIKRLKRQKKNFKKGYFSLERKKKKKETDKQSKRKTSLSLPSDSPSNTPFLPL